MVNIDSNFFVNNLLPKANVSKIVLEQNFGFVKEVSDPHIQSSSERERQQSENVQLSVTLHVSCLQKSSDNSLMNRGIGKVLKDKTKVAVSFIDNIEDTIDVARTLDNHIQTRQASIFDLSSESTEKKNIFLGRENEKYISISFSLNKKYNNQPSNLYIISATYAEVPQQYASAFGRDKIYSEIKIETIFEEGLVKSESSLFTIQDTQDVWAGNIIYSEGVYRTNEQPQRILNKYKIKNYKIQDFRIKKVLERKRNSFLQQNEELLSLRRREIIKDNKNKKSFFSDINISRKDEASVSFYLFYKDFIKNNCLFSSIYEQIPEETLTETALRSKIVDFKILRRRVVENRLSSNRITDERLSYTPFDGKEEILISTKDDNQRKLIQQTNLKEIRNPSSGFNSVNRSFHFIDSSIKEKTEGLYQYGVELEVSDYSINQITEHVGYVEECLNLLTKHYNAKVAIEIGSEPTDSLLNDSQLGVLVASYFNILNRYFYLDEINDEEIQKLKNALHSQISSVVNDSKGTSNFINLLQVLHDNLKQLINLEITNFDDPHIKDQTVQIKNNTNRTFKIKHYFNNDVVDASYKNKKLIKYLGDRKEGLFFNEFATVEQFTNFIQQFYEYSLVRNASIYYPFMISKNNASLSPQERIPQFGNSEAEKIEFNKIIRNNIIKQTNVTVFEVYDDITPATPSTQNPNEQISLTSPLSNIDNNQEIRNYSPLSFRESINDFYKFISKKYVKDKTIDEFFDIYVDQSQNIEFASSLRILLGFSVEEKKKKGTWLALSPVTADPELFSNFNAFGEDVFLMCEFYVPKDHRSKNMKVSEQIDYTDTFFFVKISTRSELEEIKSALGGIGNIESAVVPNNIATFNGSFGPENGSQEGEIIIPSPVTTETIASPAQEVEQNTIPQDLPQFAAEQEGPTATEQAAASATQLSGVQVQRQGPIQEAETTQGQPETVQDAQIQESTTEIVLNTPLFRGR